MGRGEGDRQQALITPRRGQAAPGKLYPDGTMKETLANASWGWRSSAEVIWDRGGIGVIIGEVSDYSKDMRLGFVFREHDSDNMISMFEARVPRRQVEGLAERLKQMGERLLVLKAGGWEVLKHKVNGSVRFALAPTSDHKQTAFVMEEWEAADDVGRFERRRRLRQIERGLRGLPANPSAREQAGVVDAQRREQEREAENRRLLSQMADGLCSDLSAAERKIVVEEALELQDQEPQTYQDTSSYPNLLHKARERAAAEAREEGSRQGSAQRLRSWASPERSS